MECRNNLRSVSFVYSCIYLSDGIGSTSVHGHRAEKAAFGLSRVMIRKQTICLDSSNYVKYTAEIPTDSKKLSLPTHTNTQNTVNKLVCVRGKRVYATASVDQEALTHTQKNIEVDKLSQCISAARDHNCKIIVIAEIRDITDCGKDQPQKTQLQMSCSFLAPTRTVLYQIQVNMM